jgi:hypothetical protein
MSVCSSISLSVSTSFLTFPKQLKSSVKIEIGCTVKKLETILVFEERMKEMKKALVEININQTNSGL